jgi:hypothetical protein
MIKLIVFDCYCCEEFLNASAVFLSYKRVLLSRQVQRRNVGIGERRKGVQTAEKRSNDNIWKRNQWKDIESTSSRVADSEWKESVDEIRFRMSQNVRAAEDS